LHLDAKSQLSSPLTVGADRSDSCTGGHMTPPPPTPACGKILV